MRVATSKYDIVDPSHKVQMHPSGKYPTCAHFCYKMVHYGIWDWRIVGFVRQVSCLLNIKGLKSKIVHNRFVSQMRAPLAACCEPAGKLWQLCKVLYVFEHKTQYLSIHAPYTHIVLFWHISNIYHHVLHRDSSNICEILLYNRQLVVITHELIYGVRAAQR